MVNKKYKDRLFRLVFGDKRSLLDLYNALNNSHYEDPERLEITTMEDAIYMSMKNDLSFLIDNVLNLYEHQSTFNPSMPLRGFFYLADVYRKYVATHKLNLYGGHLVSIPVPNYLVFYNGLKGMPDQVVLRLSDAYQSGCETHPRLELEALMLNINLGHNLEIMERCRKLREYAVFVEQVRLKIESSDTLETAVCRAVNCCIQDNILAEFLSAHRAEVLDVILTDYNEQEHIAMEREEAKEEGFNAGLTAGISKGLSVSRDVILEFLCSIGPLPAHLKKLIENETSLSTLKNWIKLAAKAESIEDFAENAGIKL